MNSTKCPFSGQYIAAAAQTKKTSQELAAVIANTMNQEPERMKVLKSYGIMDTPAEEEFDEIVRLAAYICDTPIALVSLVDDRRQWFKARFGLDVSQTPADIAFCSYTIKGSEIFIVGDALKDDRFKDNPLVTGAPGIRFYAGSPLKSPEGYNLGSLCVIDTEPRELRPDQLEMLATLSKGVMRLLQTRRMNGHFLQSKDILKNLMKLNEDFIRSRENKREVFNRMLDYILNVTGSEYGFIGEVLYRNNNPYLKSYAITNIAWNDETRDLYDKYAQEGMEFTNLNTLFGHTMVTGEPVISNDPSHDHRRGGLPKGHPDLKHYLGIPIKDTDDNLIGMLGIANKADGYDETDIDMLQPFISTCAVMVMAMQVQSFNIQMQEEQRQKDIFLANMSHEIRTPLNAIIGFNDLMRNTRLDDEQKKFVETIDMASRNLNVIINDILDISKLEAGMLILEKKPFSIESVVKQVIQLNSSKAKQKGIKLLLGFDQDIPQFVIGDETRLSQILINLVNNAVKFTSQGHVELKVIELKRENGDVKLRFTVSDTGIGIPSEKLDTIFERFTQAESSTTRVYGGTGLGLNIVKSLVGLHGGSVKLNSVVGKGTEFIIELPYPTANQDQVREKSDTEHADLRNLIEGMEVFLVEDNEHNQFLAKAYLQRNGAIVTTAINGKLAIEVLKKRKFDAILMDIQMPEMDGNETTIHIRKELKMDVPIVACSAHALESEKQRCIANGMNDYITKPYNETEMVRTLSKYWRNRSNNGPIKFGEKMRLVTAGDVKAALRNIESKEGKGFAKTLVNMFNESADGLIEEIARNLREKSWTDLQKKAHYTAGVLSNFPFMEGVEKSRHLENMVKDNNLPEAEKAAKELIDYLQSCHSQLKDFEAGVHG